MENNNILNVVMEDIQFVDIMIADIIDEGLFSRFKKTKPEVDRKILLDKAIDVSKKVLEKYKSELKNSIKIDNSYISEGKKAFLSKDENSIVIIRGDLTKFSNNPRDDEELNKFNSIISKIAKDINEELEPLHGELEDDGDWDVSLLALTIK